MTKPLTTTPGRGTDDAAPPTPRLFYLDNIRILLTVLVVLHHVALTYGNLPFWYYTEPAQDPSGALPDLLVTLNQTFFMGFFFLISGYFVPSSYDRKGARAFLRGRLVRLGIPLLLFLLVLRPVLTLGFYLSEPDRLPYPLFYVLTWDPGPMWFVETLLVFGLGYVLLRHWRDRRATAPATPPAQDGPPSGRMPGLAVIAGFLAVLVVATYLWRFLVPIGSYWPVVGLPTPAYLPQYVLLFAVGVLAARHGYLQRVPRAAGWSGLALAVTAIVVGMPLLGAAGEAVLVPGSLASLGSAAFENTVAVGVILFLLALYQRRFNRQGRLGRFLSANAYAVYFLHPLVLVGLGYALSGWQAAAVVKFAVVAALALPLCWAAARLLRSLPGAKRVF